MLWSVGFQDFLTIRKEKIEIKSTILQAFVRELDNSAHEITALSSFC